MQQGCTSSIVCCVNHQLSLQCHVFARRYQVTRATSRLFIENYSVECLLLAKMAFRINRKEGSVGSLCKIELDNLFA